MTARECALLVAALLAFLAALTVAIAARDLDPCWPDCRARFQDVRHG